MVEIVKYKAIDGKVFDNKSKCEKYEVIAEQVMDFVIALPLKGIINSDGYIQHKAGTKERVKKELIRLANEWFTEKFEDFNYALGRYIDDTNMKCLNRLMNIYMCTDDGEKQWNQPFFANNPGKGVDKRIN